MTSKRPDSDAALKQELEQLLKLDENQLCADCHDKGPRWASTSLGVFICIRCSGIHRGLGTHISKVRSTNLDTWTREQVEAMKAMGNRKANAIWEYHLPATFKRPAEHDTRAAEYFIKQKYVACQWKRKPTDPALPEAAPVDAKPTASAEAGGDESSGEVKDRSRDRDSSERRKHRSRRDREKGSSKSRSSIEAELNLLHLDDDAAAIAVPSAAASGTAAAPPSASGSTASLLDEPLVAPTPAAVAPSTPPPSLPPRPPASPSLPLRAPASPALAMRAPPSPALPLRPPSAGSGGGPVAAAAVVSGGAPGSAAATAIPQTISAGSLLSLLEAQGPAPEIASTKDEILALYGGGGGGGSSPARV